MQAIKNVLGNRKASVSKEITKIHEKTYRGNIDEIISVLLKEDIKGEFVIVIEGKKEEKKEMSLEKIKDIFDKRIKTNENPKETIKKLSKEYNINKRELYSFLMKK